ncbi:hypothetical protein [Bordetella sp. 15P40C-2]|uniref:hypothetical protein n=1 Tax=Bordetella sp. 15P40C-2 TaxID=2572246 RepID=UPI0013227A2A|nr:hypothetical protein [Bordetella sp. 15P40C-2]MVW72171.1 hypothetical protein [Bordetella sp. 15P40C-2]
MTAHTPTTQPHPGYAGVTVWIGDKSITRVVPAEALDKPYYDPLAVLFADANADLRNAHLWSAPQSENRPANVRTCLPVVQRIDTSPERVEETAKCVHDAALSAQEGK